MSKTLAVTWARYEVALERPHLFAAPIAVQGGRAAYDLKTGLGNSFLQLQLPSSGSQLLFYDLEPETFLLAPMAAGVLPAGRSWISAPLSTPAADHMLAAQAAALAPVLLLDEVEWGARGALSLGTQVVKTVPVAEYRVSVDLEPALAARDGRGSGSGLGTTSFLFSSFSRPYTGTLPPASQVVPLASLMRGSKSVWAIATGS